MAVLRIKPSHPSQGDFVIIEEENFNHEIHELYVEGKVEEKQRREPKEPKAPKEPEVKEPVINTLGDK